MRTFLTISGTFLLTMIFVHFLFKKHQKLMHSEQVVEPSKQDLIVVTPIVENPVIGTVDDLITSIGLKKIN